MSSGHPPPDPEAWATADPVARALHFLRISGVVYCACELGQSWAFALPPMPGCMQFHVVTGGRVWLEVPGAEPRALQAGDLALVPHGEGHALLAEPGLAPRPFFDLPRERHGERYERLRLGDAIETTMICGAVRFDDALAARLIAALPRRIVIEADAVAGWDWLQTLLRLLATEAREPKPGGEAVITRLADILVIQAIRNWLTSAPAARTGWLGALRDRRIGRALVLMHEQPAEDWTLERLAAAVAMSRSAFAARFAGIVGQPPRQYLVEWRMTLARQRLESGEARVADVAAGVGYDSEASFSRAFRRWSGVAPGAVSRRSSRAASRFPKSRPGISM